MRLMGGSKLSRMWKLLRVCWLLLESRVPVTFGGKCGKGATVMEVSLFGVSAVSFKLAETQQDQKKSLHKGKKWEGLRV